MCKCKFLSQVRAQVFTLSKFHCSLVCQVLPHLALLIASGIEAIIHVAISICRATLLSLSVLVYAFLVINAVSSERRFATLTDLLRQKTRKEEI